MAEHRAEREGRSVGESQGRGGREAREGEGWKPYCINFYR